MKTTEEQVKALIHAQQALWKFWGLRSTIVISIGDVPELVVGAVRGGSIGLVAAAVQGDPPLRGYDLWSSTGDLKRSDLLLKDAIKALATDAMGATAN